MRFRLVDATVRIVVELCTDAEWPDDDGFKLMVVENVLDTIGMYNPLNRSDVEEFANAILDDYKIVEEYGEGD